MINMGLVGLGKMGKYHLNLYDEIKELTLTGVCDIDEALVSDYAKRHNVFFTTDYKNLVDKVDAVTIALPTRFHYEAAKFFLSAGKHVLVEKPITTDYNQALELFEIADQKGVILHIGHVERFNGAVQELKNIVSSPKIVEARRVGPFNPGFKQDSIVLDLMIHDIDIAMNIVSKKVTSVQAMGSPVYSELADFASVNMMFEDGAMAHIYVSRINQNKERFLHINQEDAQIILDYTNQDINIIRKGQSKHIFGERELKYKNEFTQERLFVYKDNPLKMEIKHFLHCVEGSSKRMVSPEHDLQVLKIALDIDDLLKKGRYGTGEF